MHERWVGAAASWLNQFIWYHISWLFSWINIWIAVSSLQSYRVLKGLTLSTLVFRLYFKISNRNSLHVRFLTFMWACWPHWVIFDQSNGQQLKNVFVRLNVPCDYPQVIRIVVRSKSFRVFRPSNVIAERSPKGINSQSTADFICVHSLSTYRYFALSLTRFNPASMGKKLRSNIGASSTECSHLHSCLAGGQFLNVEKYSF